MNYEVNQFEFQIPDKYKENPSYNVLKKRYENISTYANEIDFTLKINDNHSLFETIEILELPRELGKSIRSGLLAMEMNGEFYYDSVAESIYHKKSIGGEKFTLVTNRDNYKWKLHNELKYILDKKCLKATRTDTINNSKGVFLKKIIAWYCPSIPLSYGPSTYIGLPGLVLGVEVQESNKFYSIEATSMNNEKEIDINFQIVNPTTKNKLDSLLVKNKVLLRGS